MHPACLALYVIVFFIILLTALYKHKKWQENHAKAVERLRKHNIRLWGYPSY